MRKTLYDNADEETPYGQTVAQVADRISQLRGNLTIQVDPATAPQGEDQGITVNDVSASTMLWLLQTECLTNNSCAAALLACACLPARPAEQESLSRLVLLAAEFQQLLAPLPL